MKRLLFLFFILLWTQAAFSQLEVSPGSFKETIGFVNTNPDDNYQTDDNNLPFAVIKVRTVNITDKQRRDLIFEGNSGTFIMLEYKIGEVWVYLTAKYADYIKISHPEFSSCEYILPFDLMPKHGYEMTLVNKTPNTIGSGSLMVTTKPESDATIVLNGKVIGQKTPYINDVIAAGKYDITVSKERYKTVTKTISVADGDKIKIEIEMPIDVALITIKSDDETDVYIDGKLMKHGTWTGELYSGQYYVECRKEFHRPVSQTISVNAGQPKVYEFHPIPITGTLNVESEPSGATIYIDDDSFGTTPKVLTNILIGNHNVRLEKKNYNPYTQTIVVTEDNRTDMNVVLSYGKEILIETGNVGDKVFVDGKEIGKSPIKIVMSYGKHTVSAYSGKKLASRDILVEKEGGVDKVSLSLIKWTFANYAEMGYKYITVDVSLNQYNYLAYGITLGSIKKFGWFVGGVTNFNFDTYANYECDADHYINGSYPEYTGVESYTSVSVIGGLLVRVSGPMALKIGGGYGMRLKRYETNNGYWVKNSTMSAQGVDYLLGLQWNFRGFIISMDCITTAFKTYELKIGVGCGIRNK